MLVERGRLEEVPESLHGIIAARLDALADVEKRLLQDAAIVGKVFWLGALEAMGGVSRSDADELLQSLVRREFVQRARHSSVAGDTEYAFRHELLRDVAYDEIPRARKAERHRRAAEWIESLGRVEDHAELLAYHYLAALDYGRAGDDVDDVVDRARQALQAAGLRAMRLSANERSVEYFSRAIALLGRLPEGEERARTEAELQLQLGVALFASAWVGRTRGGACLHAGHRADDGERPRRRTVPGRFRTRHLPRPLRQLRPIDTSRREADRPGVRRRRLDEAAGTARPLDELFVQRTRSTTPSPRPTRGWASTAPKPTTRPPSASATTIPASARLALQALAFALRGDSLRAVTQMHEAIALSERPRARGDSRAAADATAVGSSDQRRRSRHVARIGAGAGARGRGRPPAVLRYRARDARLGALAPRAATKRASPSSRERFADELRASHIWAAMIGAILVEVHLRHGRPASLEHCSPKCRRSPSDAHDMCTSPSSCGSKPSGCGSTGAKTTLVSSCSGQSRPLASRGRTLWRFAPRSRSRGPPSADRDADLRLLGDLFERLSSRKRHRLRERSESPPRRKRRGDTAVSEPSGTVCASPVHHGHSTSG